MVVSELLPPFVAIVEDFNYKNMFPIQYEKAPKTKWFFLIHTFIFHIYKKYDAGVRKKAVFSRSKNKENRLN